MLLEHQDVILEFGSSSWWKELNKEMGSEILPSGDRSCGKTFKPIASLIAKMVLDRRGATWSHRGAQWCSDSPRGLVRNILLNSRNKSSKLGTESKSGNESSNSGNDTNVDGAYIRPTYDTDSLEKVPSNDE
ncbi:hypothetical protein Tco_0195763 [Tanacetum coccineum]